METNIFLATDAYKGSHHKLYPRDAEATRFYLAPRAPISPNQKEFVVFGFKYFVETFLRKSPALLEDQLDQAMEIWNEFGIQGAKYPFPEEQFRKLIQMDKWPINIYGLKEGTVKNTYNQPIAIIEATDPEFVWLPGFLETCFQRAIWYPSTVATISRNVKKLLKEFYVQTVADDAQWSLDYRLHDFGARGATSSESAAIGGLAHLINFQGTDTMEAVLLGKQLYNMRAKDLACSIPAAEHSTVTSFGPNQENERTSLEQEIEEFGNGVFAFVSDSYNYRDFVDKVWGNPEIIKKIRDKGGMAVVRPDSGDQIREPLYALQSLEKSWGYELNHKGYKVLKGIAVIQGDGMTPKTIKELYETITAEKFAANNLAIGMGGGLLQRLDRDTMKWSMKLYQIKRQGQWMNVQKKPATQSDKIGWNPVNGIDFANWVCYYAGKQTFDLPAADYDFQKIRERAKV